MEETENYYSVKMRASRTEDGAELHVSGAEKIIRQEHLHRVVEELLDRALHHAKGKAEQIHLKVETVAEEEIIRTDALPVRTISVHTAGEGQEELRKLLDATGVKETDKILASMKDTYGMRGAMLLNADTLERMEPDHARGIRATYMDVLNEEDDRRVKNHFKEALVLATKVARHPNIIGELCISDDPDYVTGYFASKEEGYVRITKLKEPGSPDGGRIFLFRGTAEEAAACIQYLQETKMLVRIPEVNLLG